MGTSDNVWAFFYVLILVSCFLLNGLVLVSVFKYRNTLLQKRFAILFSLAAADLMKVVPMAALIVAVIAGPKSATGRNACSLSSTLSIIFISVTSAHLATESVNRLVSIVWPFNYEKLLNSKIARGILPAIWVVPIIGISVPPAVMFGDDYSTYHVLRTSMYSCSLDSPIIKNESVRSVKMYRDFAISITVLFYVIPFAIMVMSYSVIFKISLMHISQIKRIEKHMAKLARDRKNSISADEASIGTPTWRMHSPTLTIESAATTIELPAVTKGSLLSVKESPSPQQSRGSKSLTNAKLPADSEGSQISVTESPRHSRNFRLSETFELAATSKKRLPADSSQQSRDSKMLTNAELPTNSKGLLHSVTESPRQSRGFRLSETSELAADSKETLPADSSQQSGDSKPSKFIEIGGSTESSAVAITQCSATNLAAPAASFLTELQIPSSSSSGKDSTSPLATNILEETEIQIIANHSQQNNQKENEIAHNGNKSSTGENKRSEDIDSFYKDGGMASCSLDKYSFAAIDSKALSTSPVTENSSSPSIQQSESVQDGDQTSLSQDPQSTVPQITITDESDPYFFIKEFSVMAAWAEILRRRALEEDQHHYRILHLPDLIKAELKAKRREIQLAMTLGGLLVVFVVFYVPLMTFSWNNIVSHNHLTSYSFDLGRFLVAWAFLNSTLNPLIYCLRVPELRKSVKKLNNSVKHFLRTVFRRRER